MASLPENLPGNAVCGLQMSPNRIVEPRIPLRELIALPRPLVVNYKLPPQKPRTPFGDRTVPLKHILWTRQCMCVVLLKRPVTQVFKVVVVVVVQDVVILVMAALSNRAGHYIFAL